MGCSQLDVYLCWSRYEYSPIKLHSPCACVLDDIFEFWQLDDTRCQVFNSHDIAKDTMTLLLWWWSHPKHLKCPYSKPVGRRYISHSRSISAVDGHDDVIKWKHFPRYWPFVRGIHRSPVDSPHKDQWRGALMFSLICAWTNGWAIETPVIWDTIALIMTSL